MQGIPVLRQRAGGLCSSSALRNLASGNLVAYFSTVPTSTGILLSSIGDQERDLQPGRAYLSDGTNDYVDLPDIGTVDIFEGYVELQADNQELWTLANTTATALTVSSGVLTAGASLTISAITVDGVSKTASEAGVLLNNNTMQLLRVEFSSAVATTNLRFFTDGSAFGNVKAFGWKFSNGTTDRAFYKMDEQSGTTSYDSSGNGNNGTITNATLATFHSTQDTYSYQNQVGLMFQDWHQVLSSHSIGRPFGILY